MPEQVRHDGTRDGASMIGGNAGGGADAALFAKLGVRPMAGEESMRVAAE